MLSKYRTKYKFGHRGQGSLLCMDGDACTIHHLLECPDCVGETKDPAIFNDPTKAMERAKAIDRIISPNSKISHRAKPDHELRRGITRSRPESLPLLWKNTGYVKGPERPKKLIMFYNIKNRQQRAGSSWREATGRKRNAAVLEL